MATAIGFAIMGFIGFFVKLIHIPINNIIVWVKTHSKYYWIGGICIYVIAFLCWSETSSTEKTSIDFNNSYKRLQTEKKMSIEIYIYSCIMAGFNIYLM